jgi:hypothetical protein
MSPVADHPSQTALESIHSLDGTYCVDVMKTAGGFALQTCRRDEGRWQVIDRPGSHQSLEDAVACARTIIERLNFG